MHETLGACEPAAASGAVPRIHQVNAEPGRASGGASDVVGGEEGLVRPSERGDPVGLEAEQECCGRRQFQVARRQ